MAIFNGLRHTAFAALLCALSAHALAAHDDLSPYDDLSGKQSVYIVQAGQDNQAQVNQAVSGGSLSLAQQGSANLATMNQHGALLRMQAQQQGLENQLIIQQAGYANQVSVYQQGSGNSSTIWQRGAYNQASTQQVGQNNQIVISQTGTKGNISIAQNGNNMRAKVTQW